MSLGSTVRELLAELVECRQVTTGQWAKPGGFPTREDVDELLDLALEHGLDYRPAAGEWLVGPVNG